MGKHVCIIGTGFSNFDDLRRLFKEADPTIRVNMLAEDSLIQDILANHGPSPSVIKRLCTYAMMAEESGADLIINQCSSVGHIADLYAKMVKVPVLKIDQAMAEKAISIVPGCEILQVAR